MLAAAVLAALALAAPATSKASPNVRYGIQDGSFLGSEAALEDGGLATLDTLGVKLVRVTVNWREVALHRPERPLDPKDAAYDWTSTDQVLRTLHRHGISVLVTLWGAPGWANGGQGASVVPLNKRSLAYFAGAVATRYPWVRLWEVWNEPNLCEYLDPCLPRLYVHRLLNPTYTLLHRLRPGVRVAGGSTSPRPTPSGPGPVEFMRGMRAAHARLDAYSHHPYPVTRGERPSAFARGVCRYCKGILTLATLPLLVREVRRDFPRARIWLTEYGYQTDPRKRIGVSQSAQARYVSEAALRAWQTPRVDIFIHFLLRDEPRGGWQSGLMTFLGRPKPSFYSFMLPFAEVSRARLRTVIWGQVRPGEGRRLYRLQRFAFGRWVRVGADVLTSPRGFFRRALSVAPGTRLRVVTPGLETTGNPLTVR